MVGIEDEVHALDFDLICTHRLVIYDGETMQAQSKLNAYEIGKVVNRLMGGEEPEEEVEMI